LFRLRCAHIKCCLKPLKVIMRRLHINFLNIWKNMVISELSLPFSLKSTISISTLISKMILVLHIIFKGSKWWRCEVHGFNPQLLWIK
jgi:hypothetical protein